MFCSMAASSHFYISWWLYRGLKFINVFHSLVALVSLIIMVKDFTLTHDKKKKRKRKKIVHGDSLLLCRQSNSNIPSGTMRNNTRSRA